MMMSKSILLLVLFALSLSHSCTTNLQLLTVLFRHGDRTPIRPDEVYPKDPCKNHDFYPLKDGQLTNRGKMRAYKLGKFLAEHYKSFFDPIYTSDMLHAQSTDVHRTKSTLQLVLAGLLPPILSQVWNDELLWQPIPISYTPLKLDSFLLGKECKRHREEYFKVIRSLPVLREMLVKYGDLASSLEKLSGKRVMFPCDMSDFYQGFLSKSNFGLPLPDWAHDYFPDGLLLNGTLFCLDVQSYNLQLKKLNGGPIVRKISEDMVARKNETMDPRLKLFLYSAHEVTIAGFLKALDIPMAEVPSYSSAVMIELRKSTLGIDYVQLLYYNGDPPTIRKLRIPGCDVKCPLKDFLQLTRHVWPSDEELQCDRH